jgi:MFS family permease
MKLLLLGILLFILSQTTVWFQINGQFIWKFFKENPLIISLLGVPISYFFLLATKYTVQGFDGLMWPSRFIGFGIGIIVYGVLVGYFFNEGISTKTLISIILSIVIILIQILWKS